MLKSDLVNLLMRSGRLSLRQAEQVVDEVFDSMRDALARGEGIEIRGLGTFHVKSYRGYTGRNPRTAEVIDVPPKRGVIFRAGKEMRARLNASPPAADASDREDAA